MTQPTEPTPAPVDAIVDDDTPPDPQTIAEARKLRQENKSLRSRLRALETDHEAAVTRLAALEHAEVERHAGEVLIDPADIWRHQPDMQAFYDDEFHSIVGDKVVAAAKALVAAKPHLAAPQKAPPPTDRPIESLRPGARAEETPTAPTWATVIRATMRVGFGFPHEEALTKISAGTLS